MLSLSLDIGCPGQARCAISMYACGMSKNVPVVILMNAQSAEVRATACFHL